ALWKVRRGVLDRAADLALERRFGLGQKLPRPRLLCPRRRYGRRDLRHRDKGRGGGQQGAPPYSFPVVRRVSLPIILTAHDLIPSRLMQRKPTWLFEVSTGLGVTGGRTGTPAVIREASQDPNIH